METLRCGLPRHLSSDGTCLVCAEYDYMNPTNPILQDAYYGYQYNWHHNIYNNPRHFESDLLSKYHTFIAGPIRSGLSPRATVNKREAEIIRRVEQWIDA